ncbi:MAG: PAS domain S-box protein [Spirochaetaceae bacterium]|nr:MAG: PAS domain S-box protein [Spirochaetaceae bacterium]
MISFKDLRLKISSKVALSFVILVLLQGIVTLIALTLIVSRTQNDSLRTQMNRAVSGIEGYLQETLEAQMVNANLLSGQAKVIDYTAFGLTNLLRRELSVYRSSLQMDSLSIYLEPNAPFTSVGNGLMSTSALEAQLERSFQGEKTFFVTSGVEHIKLSVLTPIAREDRIIGVLSLSRSLDPGFVQNLENITNSKIILLFGNLTTTAGDLSVPIIRKIIAAAENENIPAGMTRIDGFVVSSLTMESFREPGGKIFCLLDTTEYRRIITRYYLISLITTFLILSIALLIGIFFYRVTFNRPFQYLLKGVHKISEGDLHYQFQVPAKDEFGDLAKAFNMMRVNLIARERELLQLSLYNTLILENVRTGIITVNLEEEVTTFNPAAIRILSMDSEMVKGVKITSQVFPHSLSELIGESLKDNSSYVTGKEVIIGQRGQNKILALSTSPLLSKDGEKIGMIAIFEDITRVKQLEEKLSVSSRLAALGEMAAGVAHQIRNPLGVMKVSAEMLRDYYRVVDDERNYQRITHMMISEIDTLNIVIRNLLDFARPRDVQKSPCSINEIIRCSLGSLPLDKYPALEIKTLDLDHLPDYLMDKSLIEQVLSNLILNAIQASPPDGKIQISADMKQGHMQIIIQDWGCGFDESTRKQIFNPFFTTKSDGTGLGLSISHRIIEQHSGTIDVFSQPGGGSTFRVTL